MTDLETLLKEAGWASEGLAVRMGINTRTVAGWVSGRRPAPMAVLAWLRRVIDAIAAVGPPPKDWGDRSP